MQILDTRSSKGGTCRISSTKVHPNSLPLKLVLDVVGLVPGNVQSESGLWPPVVVAAAPSAAAASASRTARPICNTKTTARHRRLRTRPRLRPSSSLPARPSSTTGPAVLRRSLRCAATPLHGRERPLTLALLVVFFITALSLVPRLPLPLLPFFTLLAAC